MRVSLAGISPDVRDVKYLPALLLAPLGHAGRTRA
jgi:hypothetical protein